MIRVESGQGNDAKPQLGQEIRALAEGSAPHTMPMTSRVCNETALKSRGTSGLIDFNCSLHREKHVDTRLVSDTGSSWHEKIQFVSYVLRMIGWPWLAFHAFPGIAPHTNAAADINGDKCENGMQLNFALRLRHKLYCDFEQSHLETNRIFYYIFVI